MNIMIAMTDINYYSLYTYTKKARYKQIENNYFHFLFQGYRIESLCDDKDMSMITCICKVSSPKKSNKLQESKLQIIYIQDNYNSLIFNKDLFDKFLIEFKNYINSKSEKRKRKLYYDI